MIYELILLFLFWLVHIARRSLFFLYFFQIKEYRLDRSLEEIKRKKELFFSKYFFLGLILLFFYKLIPFYTLFIFHFLYFLYFIFFLYSFYSFLKKKWHFPIFTSKMIIWVVLVFTLEIGFFFLFLKTALYIILLEIFLPLFLFLSLQIVQFFVSFAKKRIIKKASRKNLNMRVIGITGSYGKTTTKEILYQLLKTKYKVVKTKEHINTEIGIAKTVLNIKDADIFICEMGAYKRGEIKAICNIVKPDIGIITGINEQHLALFGSQANIVKGKYELIESLPEDGLTLFNGENKYCLELFKKTKKKKILYQFPENLQVNKEGSIFSINNVQFTSKLLGKHNVLNILGAVKIALELGVSLEECAKICRDLGQELGGMVLRGRVIDSSYSSNPDGVMAALDYLSLWEGKKAIVIRGLIELGPASKEIHQKIEKRILDVCDIAITTTKGVFKNIEFVSSTETVMKKLQDADIILIEGRASEKLIKKLYNN
jgi:UDP-N-acetylmuramoyl-tripeptide--D-alanyl-D-alanine ligase